MTTYKSSATIYRLPQSLTLAMREASRRHRLEQRTFFVVRERCEAGHPDYSVADSRELDTFYLGCPVVYCTED